MVLRKCYGSTIVGSRGQIVIPIEARKELGMGMGTRLLVFRSLEGEALLLLRSDAVEQFLGQIAEGIRMSESSVGETD